MTNSDILLYQSCKKPVELNHNCKIENGIENDEIFTINTIIKDFEQLELVNQYGQFVVINPNQITNENI